MVNEDGAEHLGGGVVIFRQTAGNSSDRIAEDIDASVDASLAAHYDLRSEPGYAINPSGHRIPIRDLATSCQRVSEMSPSLMQAAKAFEGTFDSLLPKYLCLFPMALPTLWWKTEGHFIKYPTGSALGLHCDNDINYQPGHEPDSQLGIYHVLAAIRYVAGAWDGGELEFPYLGIKLTVGIGDTIFFPANFMAAHEVHPVTSGTRYAYLTYYGHGTASNYGPNVREPSSSQHGGQVWIRSLFDNYRELLQEKYGDNPGDRMRPLLRETHSSGTLGVAGE